METCGLALSRIHIGMIFFILSFVLVKISHFFNRIKVNSQGEPPRPLNELPGQPPRHTQTRSFK